MPASSPAGVVPALRLDGVSFTYGEGTPFVHRALDRLSCDILPGVVTGIIGQTGSGKSTLVQLCNGLLTPQEGRVLLFGHDIWEKPKEISSVRYRVGLVFQYPEYQLFEETVAKDIAFGPKNMGLTEVEISVRVREAAEFVGLPSSLLGKSPFELSGGQKRRAAIAGVIAMRPEVLILDEPAAGLDPSGREGIFSSLREYQRESGKAMVIVSHSMEDMAKYASRVLVLREGRLLLEGETHEVFSHTDLLLENGLAIPGVARVIELLRARGVNLPAGIFTVEEAAAALLPLLRGQKD